MSIKKDILWRVGLVYLSVAVFAVFIVVKIIYLQYFDNEQWEDMAAKTRVKDIHIIPHRGDIYDSNMRLLASSIPYYEVRMDMCAPAITNAVFKQGIDSLALSLSRLFRDRSWKQYKADLTKARREGNRYFLVKNKVDYVQLKQLKTFPILRKGRYKGGLIICQDNVRKRPHNSLAGRTIGYISKSEYGNVVGIEGAFDKYLGGVEGVKKMQKLYGNIWMPIDEAGEIEPRDGSSVVTTIDIEFQDVAEKALRKQLINSRAHHGSVVLMEVATGEVKAIVNLSDTLGTYIEDYNYAIGESTEPGSTFKIPAILAALEDGYVDLDDTINTFKGIIYYKKHPVRDDNYDRGGHGIITVKQVVELSSNVGMARIITQNYEKRPGKFVDRLYQMNLNTPLDIEIKGEGQPLIRYPGDKLWSGVSIASMSYGYEIRLTPLQILTFYNAIANEGTMVKPKFAREIRTNGKVEKTFPTEIINPSICSSSSLKKVREMLEGVVEEGTATNLKNDYLKIAGKTGTTQIYNSRYGYKMGEEVSYQASFVGYFPADNPQYSCIVVVNSPSSSVYHGNRVAGPVFEEIARKVYATNLNMQLAVNDSRYENVLEIPYTKNGFMEDLVYTLRKLEVKNKRTDRNAEWVTATKKDNYVELSPKKVNNGLVPNVVSMGLKDAVYLLENMGLKVDVQGRGSVRSQSLAPGTKAQRGQYIRLQMSYTEG